MEDMRIEIGEGQLREILARVLGERFNQAIEPVKIEWDISHSSLGAAYLKGVIVHL